MVHLVKKINIKMINTVTKVNSFDVRLPKKNEGFESYIFLKGIAVIIIPTQRKFSRNILSLQA